MTETKNDVRLIDYSKNPVANSLTGNMQYRNEHASENWIIEDGQYYKPIGDITTFKPDKNKNNIKIKNNKVYELVENESPKKINEGYKYSETPKQDRYSDDISYTIGPGVLSSPVMGNSPKNYIDNNDLDYKAYTKEFGELNKAISKGQWTTANNRLQSINTRYFGKSYSDEFIKVNSGANNDTTQFFYDRFNNNLAKLETINNSITNTSDAEVLKYLYHEKDLLELENTLIQYNKILATASINNKIDNINKYYEENDKTWDKVNKAWNSTLDAWDDGYQFGDVFKTFKRTINNSLQTLGATGKTINNDIQAIGQLTVSDLDDNTLGKTLIPAFIDTGTYIIPYVGQARFIINLAEPVSVASSYLTQEGSVTVNSSDNNPRVATFTNFYGAATNIALNYLSNAIYGRMRSRLGQEGMKKLYSETGRSIGLMIFEDAAGEGLEEFGQTYAEYLQNYNYDDYFDWESFKKLKKLVKLLL